MTANSNKSKQGNKAAHRVIAGVLCGASVLSLVLSLVMPPISQAIANDAQMVSTEETVMGGGSSSESTDVDDTTNGDTDNQNSDETEGYEAGFSNSDEQAQAEEQLDDELQVEDGEPADGSVVELVAVNEQSQTSANEIASAADLESKLKAVRENETASFELTQDIECSSTIQLEKSRSNITLDLNGCKIKHTSKDQPLFNITGGATLTVKDSQRAAAKEIEANRGNKYGNLASMEYDDATNIPTSLTYYVTESSPNGTGTTETLKAYKANIAGAIVACGGADANGLKLVNLFNGGHFILESGALTQKKGDHVSNLIYAENGSTVNISGGYVCGASTGTSGTGAGVMVSNANGSASTLSLTGNGVVAGNYALKGGGVYSAGSNVFVSENAVISGNATFDDQKGLGGGISASGGSVTVSGGYVTNNKYARYCGNEGWGDCGGGGLAANNGAHVTISGGQIAGNYSEEAGGGVYVTDVDRNDQSRTGMAWLNITGGNIASNVSYRSEGAGVRVGQMVDAMISGTTSKVYITNNHCMSRFDWGGGGIFVQGNSNADKEYTDGRLFVYNSYISSNTAGGYGGGVAVCPTGKTLVTNTEGTAIFGNISAGTEHGWNNNYNKTENTGNDGKPHLSGGGSGKNQDKDAYDKDVFRNNGHADFFLAAKDGHTEPLAAVIGKMLGGGDAKYSGSRELREAITIPANGGVQIYQSIGLTSDVHAGETEANNAQKAATTFITGNYSWNHGGGIMSNGDLYLGVPADTYVYPSLKLKATKALKNSNTNENIGLANDQFSFAVYRKDSNEATMPSWNDRTFSNGGCTLVGSAKNDAGGNITFDLGEQFLASGTTDKLTYYLVEDAGGVSDIEYDHAVYEIAVTVQDNPTLLMRVPKKDSPNEDVPLYVHNYTIANVNVTRHPENTNNQPDNVSLDEDGYYPIACSGESKTFTNKYTPYISSGSWTPKATKVVEGGEMKEFTLQLAKDKEFTSIVGNKSTTADDNDKSQTLSFDEIKYTLDDLTKGEDTTGRGASKTFTYYVREQKSTTPFTNYKYDKSVYRFDVTMTDQKDGRIVPTTVTYTKIKDADGNPIDKANPVNYNDGSDNTKPVSIPTFTNTYSTSLPLSGMSGVTLTYLAGAAVLCAAAAWMHIRRKANAKGGERRE